MDAKEKEVRQQCKALEFKFAKRRSGNDGWRYRITDSVTKLYYSKRDFRYIIAAVKAAMKEQEAQKPAEPKQEKKVEFFDPFDL